METVDSECDCTVYENDYYDDIQHQGHTNPRLTFIYIMVLLIFARLNKYF